VEFCLVAKNKDSRWTFPVGRAAPDAAGLRAALDKLMELTGLDGDVEFDEPLDEFRASSAVGAVSAFLVRVEKEQENGRDMRLRRRWCLPEEARMRIRRKPMRRLIDIALRRIQSAPRPC
jgi:hypothetical protein